MNLYLLAAFDWMREVRDYTSELRSAVVVAKDEVDARSLIPEHGDCEHECPHHTEVQHGAKCFWVTSPDVTVTLLGTAAPGMSRQIVMLKTEKGWSE